MKYIAICTKRHQPRVDLTSLGYDPLYFRTARFELLQKLIAAGHYGCIVLNGDYLGGGKFSKHYYPLDADALTYEERGPVTVDVLYDKGHLAPKGVPSLNDPVVTRICESKLETFKLFGRFQPQSLEVKNQGDLKHIASLDNGSRRVVVKAPISNGGRDVIIAHVEDILSGKITLPDYPFIAQEFIETSHGIPGLVQGRHDVRVILLDGMPVGAAVRQPAEGQLLSNTNLGGSFRALKVAEVPPALLRFAKKIDARLPQKPRLYSADFMYDAPQDKWYLVELNSRPGTMSSMAGEQGVKFQQVLVDYLINM